MGIFPQIIAPRWMSVVGLFVFVLFAWLLSAHKRRVPFRVVIGGFLVQFVLAWIVLKTSQGRAAFRVIGDFFTATLDYVDHGSQLVFGDGFTEHYFAFKVLPTIIFFSSLMAVLYHAGIVQRIVAVFARFMQFTLGTSGAESLSASANIFVGQTEAPLVIRPYIDSMTMSELMTVMVGGFATIAGGVLAAYVGMGIDAGHLVSASVISAPAALMIGKIMQPEVETPQTLGTVKLKVERTHVNLIEAAAAGATDGLKLALNVAAMLIAFTALVFMADGALEYIGQLVATGLTKMTGDEYTLNWSLTGTLAWVFAPMAYLMGIEAKDCLVAGRLLGLKTAVNELMAYDALGKIIKSDTNQLSQRTHVILTYALCGFANFSSIGIQLGGIGAIAPKRRPDLAKLSLRAMIGGTLAAFLTACIAGFLYEAN